MREEIQTIVEKYKKSIIQSEAEVESKFIVPLVECLGFPSEFRAEQFPVHGFQGRTKLPAKPADFILFDDRNFANHKKYNKKNLDWVQDHALLIIEAKKPEEMPDVMGQAQFYSHWTKAIAYIVTDGVDIKGYYRNPISSDETFLDCKVSDLSNNDEVEFFSYQRIKAIKDIDFKAEIEKRINVKSLDDVKVQQGEDSFPVELINYMRIVLGDDSDGMSDKEVVDAYMTNGHLSSEGRFSEQRSLFGIPESVSNPIKALLYIEGNLLPYMNGYLTRYCSILGTERVVFENQYIYLEILCVAGETLGFKAGFHVQDYVVSTRGYNLSRVKRVFDAEKATIKSEDGEIVIEVSPSTYTKGNAYCIAQEGILDYWIWRMDQMKTIEEYYGIAFHLRPGLNSEETSEVYNTVDIVYDGIARRANITFENEDEELFSEIPKDETITLDCPDISNADWHGLEIHNYRFIPRKIRLIPNDEKKVDVSIEFAAEEIENG